MEEAAASHGAARLLKSLPGSCRPVAQRRQEVVLPVRLTSPPAGTVVLAVCDFPGQEVDATGLI